MNAPQARMHPLARPHALATLGSATQQGGTIATANSGVEIDDRPVACVGDLVHYPDGSQTIIISGAGMGAMRSDGRLLAIEGSHLHNGDVITTSLQQAVIVHSHDSNGQPVPGFLQPGYTFSAKE